jgi:hypothetical protein
MEHKTITKLLQETGSEKTDLNTKLMLKTFFIVCHYKINIFVVIKCQYVKKKHPCFKAVIKDLNVI